MSGETPRRVLVIAAHPDDPEYGCAATAAKRAAEGCEVVFCILTSGDKGSKDPAVRPGQLAGIREKEQKAAAESLGVGEVIFRRYPDGMLESTMALRRELAGIIREKMPHIVLTMDPWKRYQTHPDHRAAGQAALDAVYAAKETYLFPEQLIGAVEPWRVPEVLLFWTDAPDYWEDVSGFIDKRIRALGRHASQVDEGPRELDRSVREEAAEAAKESGLGFQYAEAFKRLYI
jgi:LmbE family N-acetylglucosaminyl deacetylase